MKKTFSMLAVFLLVVGSLWFVWFATPEQNLPLVEPVYKPQPLTNSLTTITVESQHVEPLQPLQSDGTPPKAIPEKMQRATDDPAVAELFENFKWTEVGRIVKTENGIQQLWDGARLVFEAKRISERRSKSADGTIALSAVTGDKPPIENAEVTGAGNDAKLISSPREIWIITPDGKKFKISPPNIDAFAPLIEPSGKFIAFTGRLLNDKGFPSSQRLYVGNTTTDQYRVFSGDEHLHNYQIWAVDWVQNSAVLRVLQDHGETGGHMKLKQVRVK